MIFYSLTFFFYVFPRKSLFNKFQRNSNLTTLKSYLPVWMIFFPLSTFLRSIRSVLISKIGLNQKWSMNTHGMSVIFSFPAVFFKTRSTVPIEMPLLFRKQRPKLSQRKHTLTLSHTHLHLYTLTLTVISSSHAQTLLILSQSHTSVSLTHTNP